MLTDEGKNVFPSYYQIQCAKSICYPPKEKIHISDSSASVELQAILDLTVDRILKTCQDIDFEELGKLTLICKWGFDGASGQSLYNQSFEHDKATTDSNIFISSLVPLKLFNDSNQIVWENEQLLSTRLCRPIKFQFVKESTVIKQEKERIDTQIKNLLPTTLNEKLVVNHKLVFTMIDGKICSLSEVSSACCYICDATPKEMNNLKSVSTKTANKEHFKFGLSTLHCWIRCFEFFLHLSYKISVKSGPLRHRNIKIK